MSARQDLCLSDGTTIFVPVIPAHRWLGSRSGRNSSNGDRRRVSVMRAKPGQRDQYADQDGGDEQPAEELCLASNRALGLADVCALGVEAASSHECCVPFWLSARGLVPYEPAQHTPAVSSVAQTSIIYTN